LPLPIVERTEQEIRERISKKVEGLKDVKGIDQLQVRLTGKRTDVSLLVRVDRDLDWEEAHGIALDVEREVTREFPNARVVVNTQPLGKGKSGIWTLVKNIADAAPGSRGVHNIHIQTIDGKIAIDLHLEVDANMTVKQAHDVADQIESQIKAADRDVADITVHIESASERVSREMSGVETGLEPYIKHLVEGFPEIKETCEIQVRRFGNVTHLTLKCRFDSNLSIKRAHEISSKLEGAIKAAYPDVTRIDIHEEPA